MAPLILFEDYLELVGNTAASVPLCTPAYVLTDISPLLGSGDVRGSDRILPGVPGVKPYPRRRTVTEYSLDLFVDGSFDDDGSHNADPRTAVYDHLEYLIGELVDPPAGADGTRAGTLHLPDGSTRTADVTVVGIDVTATVGPASLRCVLVLSLSDGRFA